jgi:hypothetical protein
MSDKTDAEISESIEKFRKAHPDVTAVLDDLTDLSEALDGICDALIKSLVEDRKLH